MNRAIVTFGVGPHAEMLNVARPGFQRFADRHGYELKVAEPKPYGDLPPSWWKVPLLRAALEVYDEVLWLDADIVIVDDRDDIELRRGAWQAMVEHRTGDGCVPNLGVWYVRRRMRTVLDQVWKMRGTYADHPWWEQAAMLDLLGYQHNPRPCGLGDSTALYRNTQLLDAGWNVHPHDVNDIEWPRLMHATCYPDRAGQMREWAEEALTCTS